MENAALILMVSFFHYSDEFCDCYLGKWMHSDSRIIIYIYIITIASSCKPVCANYVHKSKPVTTSNIRKSKLITVSHFPSRKRVCASTRRSKPICESKPVFW